MHHEDQIKIERIAIEKNVSFQKAEEIFESERASRAAEFLPPPTESHIPKKVWGGINDPIGVD